jgi:hypothetical protein
MYRAYLSYSQLQDYLKLLQERNLIEYGTGSQQYTLTQKGIQFMSAYEKIDDLILSTDQRNAIQKRKIEAEPLSTISSRNIAALKPY